jgi:hypothetical protein
VSLRSRGWLADTLGEGHSLETVWHPFFRAAARLIETPWTIAAGSDFAFPGVTGQKPAGTDLVNWYLARVHRVASSDRVLCRTFFDVANLLDALSPSAHSGAQRQWLRGSPSRAGESLVSSR